MAPIPYAEASATNLGGYFGLSLSFWTMASPDAMPNGKTLVAIKKGLCVCLLK